MEIIQLLLGTIFIVLIFGHIMYTFVKNKAPWQLLVLALFIVLIPVAEYIKYYHGVSKLFYIINIAGVPILTITMMFLIVKMYQVKNCYKKNMFTYSFIGFLIWTPSQIYLYQETTGIYGIFSSITGLLITIAIIFTMDSKKNYMEYITK